MRIVFVDTETGGIDPHIHSLLEVGSVIWEDGEIIGEYYSRVGKPPYIVTPEALRINQIDLTEWEDTDDAHAFAAFKDYLNFANQGQGRLTLGGHQTHFDADFLKVWFDEHDESFSDWFSYRYVDTQASARLMVACGMLFGGTSLSDLHTAPVTHGALSDIKQTVQVWNKEIACMKSGKVYTPVGAD